MTLNEEYTKQLIYYQNEIEEKEKEYNERLKITNNESNKDYTPEMIPPEQTFKIFLHFVKHLPYEDILYKKYITKSDINFKKKKIFFLILN